MKVKQSNMPSAETDMTPMIDMTFQLITFFMFVMKVTDIEADGRIKLPISQIARPPEGKPGDIFILQILANGKILSAGEELDAKQFGTRLKVEVDTMRQLGKEPRNHTVLVRADQFAETSKVQEAIKVCQKNGLVNYSLRAVLLGNGNRAGPP